MKMGVNNRISFGGYGKVTQDLVAFINEFYEKKNSFRSYLYWKDFWRYG
jgi:hypothetical protein